MKKKCKMFQNVSLTLESHSRCRLFFKNEILKKKQLKISFQTEKSKRWKSPIFHFEYVR